jgi:hypothetical protein
LRLLRLWRLLILLWLLVLLGRMLSLLWSFFIRRRFVCKRRLPRESVVLSWGHLRLKLLTLSVLSGIHDVRTSAEMMSNCVNVLPNANRYVVFLITIVEDLLEGIAAQSDTSKLFEVSRSNEARSSGGQEVWY